MKENKKRITFWFIVFIIFVSFSVFGYILYNTGHGKYGSYRSILEPIVLEFNTLPEVTSLDLTAKVSKDTILVTYLNASGKKDNYEFKYQTANNIEYLTSSDKSSSSMWQYISFQMINAIYHINGGSGSVLEEYSTKVLGETTIEDGIVYSESNRTVSINISTNFVKNIEGRYESLKDEQYVKDEDLDGLMNALKTDNSFKVVKGDVTLYVTESDIEYDIYVNISDVNSKRAYKSIAAVVKILNPDVYKTLIASDGSVVILESGKKYETVSNAIFSEADVFNIDDQIFDFILHK